MQRPTIPETDTPTIARGRAGAELVNAAESTHHGTSPERRIQTSLPDMSSSTADRPVAGILVPLFALRGENDLGCGNVGALKEFIHWGLQYGFHLVQLLPVNETGQDNSPYNAISSVALEPTTMDLSDCPDLNEAEIAAVSKEHKLAEICGPSVHWTRTKALYRALLHRAFTNFENKADKKRSTAFEKFGKSEHAWLESYSLFRVLMDHFGHEQWDRWPDEVRNHSLAKTWLEKLPAEQRDFFVHEQRFAQYVQWQAFEQWRAVKKFANHEQVLLMGDVPFGVNYFSADVWANPEWFELHWSGGAPPEPAFVGDEFTRKWGQNWGVPLYRWETHRAGNFAWWLQRVRKVGEMFHLFRIDHVLGFYRIYGFPWRPQRNAEFASLDENQARQLTSGELPHFHDRPDDTDENKRLNRQQGEEFLRMLQAATGPNVLVGEDLGTVPDYVRPSLLSLGIPGFKVPLWEQEQDNSLTPRNAYPECSIVTFATHDHEPMRVLWEGWMKSISDALLDPERLASDRDTAWWQVRRLANWAGFAVPQIMGFDEVHERLLEALFSSSSRIAIVMITDLLGTSQRFNVPGEVSDFNWSSRLAWSVPQLASDSAIKAKMQHVHGMVERSGRVVAAMA